MNQGDVAHDRSPEGMKCERDLNNQNNQLVWRIGKLTLSININDIVSDTITAPLLSTIFTGKINIGRIKYRPNSLVDK